VEADQKLCSACTAYYCKRCTQYVVHIVTAKGKGQVLWCFKMQSRSRTRSVNLSGLHFCWSRQFSLCATKSHPASPASANPHSDPATLRHSTRPLFALSSATPTLPLRLVRNKSLLQPRHLFYTAIFLADLLCTLCTAYHHSLDLALSISSIPSGLASKFRHKSTHHQLRHHSTAPFS
jgi:hypothetical protein